MYKLYKRYKSHKYFIWLYNNILDNATTIEAENKIIEFIQAQDLDKFVLKFQDFIKYGTKLEKLIIFQKLKLLVFSYYTFKTNNLINLTEYIQQHSLKLSDLTNKKLTAFLDNDMTLSQTVLTYYLVLIQALQVNTDFKKLA